MEPDIIVLTVVLPVVVVVCLAICCYCHWKKNRISPQSDLESGTGNQQIKIEDIEEQTNDNEISPQSDLESGTGNQQIKNEEIQANDSEQSDLESETGNQQIKIEDIEEQTNDNEISPQSDCGTGYQQIKSQTSSDNEIFTESEVIKKAKQKNHITYLHTNEEKVYTNNKEGKHAEEFFVEENAKSKYPINTIKIKNSPCAKCSKLLINHFKEYEKKPTIYVGRIWHLRDKKDREGLKYLLHNGFQLEVWEKLHQEIYGDDPTTSNYIKGLKH